MAKFRDTINAPTNRIPGPFTRGVKRKGTSDDNRVRECIDNSAIMSRARLSVLSTLTSLLWIALYGIKHDDETRTLMNFRCGRAKENPL